MRRRMSLQYSASLGAGARRQSRGALAMPRQFFIPAVIAGLLLAAVPLWLTLDWLLNAITMPVG